MTLDQLLAAPPVRAFDSFAGTGWGVACAQLGIQEFGAELDPDAVRTRAAAGMTTTFLDVWDGLLGQAYVPAYDLAISSPPCQTFSIVGRGAGRAALEAVVQLIDAEAYKKPALLREWGAKLGHDDRTALVLTPLAYVWRDRPRLVVWEQVPTVLPVWERAAVELRGMGYSVVTGVLNAEQYGVPQTRRRAVLIARLDGLEATMPVPTHSRYYTREPDRLDEGVLPWVSMVDAVGWGFTRRPALTMTGHGILPRHPTGQQQAVMRAADLGQFTFRPPFDPGTALRDEDERGSLARRYVWGSMHASLEEAAVIQSYPADFPFYGGRSSVFLQIGNAVPPALARAILDHMTREA